MNFFLANRSTLVGELLLLRPCSSMVGPRYEICSWKNWHLSLLTFNPTYYYFLKTVFSVLKCAFMFGKQLHEEQVFYCCLKYGCCRLYIKRKNFCFQDTYGCTPLSYYLWLIVKHQLSVCKSSFVNSLPLTDMSLVYSRQKIFKIVF